MTDEKPKPRSKRTKRLRAPSRDEYVRYIVSIENWDWSYSFGLDSRKDSMDPYMEHRHLTIGGKLRHPKLLSVETVELWLLPRHDLDQDRRKDDQPTAVGGLRLDRGLLTALLPIPKDSLTAILQLLIADRFRFVDLGGARLRHRQALLRFVQSRDPHRRGRHAVDRRRDLNAWRRASGKSTTEICRRDVDRLRLQKADVIHARRAPRQHG